MSVDGSLDLAATDGANGTNTVTVSGLAIDVNKVLASLSYTPTSEYEGADTLHVTATSKDGAAAVSGVSNDATVATSRAPLSDSKWVGASAVWPSETENDTNVAIAGV